MRYLIEVRDGAEAKGREAGMILPEFEFCPTCNANYRTLQALYGDDTRHRGWKMACPNGHEWERPYWWGSVPILKSHNPATPYVRTTGLWSGILHNIRLGWHNGEIIAFEAVPALGPAVKPVRWDVANLWTSRGGVTLEGPSADDWVSLRRNFHCPRCLAEYVCSVRVKGGEVGLECDCGHCGLRCHDGRLPLAALPVRVRVAAWFLRLWKGHGAFRIRNKGHVNVAVSQPLARRR